MNYWLHALGWPEVFLWYSSPGNAAWFWMNHLNLQTFYLLICHWGYNFFPCVPHRVTGTLKRNDSNEGSLPPIECSTSVNSCDHHQYYFRNIEFSSLISSPLNMCMWQVTNTNSRQEEEAFVSRIPSWALEFGYLDCLWTYSFNMNLKIFLKTDVVRTLNNCSVISSIWR